jgi:ubiquinol-cytochrome c reductase cytochrome b subunit
LLYARLCTAYYFLHLLVVMPLLGWIEKPSAVPGSITDDVLGKKPVAAE